jgi:hypothetical protein
MTGQELARVSSGRSPNPTPKEIYRALLDSDSYTEKQARERSGYKEYNWNYVPGAGMVRASGY